MRRTSPSLSIALSVCLVAATALVLATPPAAGQPCSTTCAKLCRTLQIECTMAGSSNGLDTYTGVQQNATATEMDAHTSPSTGPGLTTTTPGSTSTPSTSPPDVVNAGIAWTATAWQAGANRTSTPVRIVLGSPVGVALTGATTATYVQNASTDEVDRGFPFEVNPGFDGTARIPFTLTTFAGTPREHVLRGNITFQARSTAPVPPAPEALPPPDMVLLVVMLASMALVLRRRIPQARAAIGDLFPRAWKGCVGRVPAMG